MSKKKKDNKRDINAKLHKAKVNRIVHRNGSTTLGRALWRSSSDPKARKHGPVKIIFSNEVNENILENDLPLNIDKEESD
jgi:hypothetical protein